MQWRKFWLTSLVNMKRKRKHNFKLAEKLSWDEIGKRTYEIYERCLIK